MGLQFEGGGGSIIHLFIITSSCEEDKRFLSPLTWFSLLLRFRLPFQFWTKTSPTNRKRYSLNFIVWLYISCQYCSICNLPMEKFFEFSVVKPFFYQKRGFISTRTSWYACLWLHGNFVVEASQGYLLIGNLLQLMEKIVELKLTG